MPFGAPIPGRGRSRRATWRCSHNPLELLLSIGAACSDDAANSSRVECRPLPAPLEGRGTQGGDGEEGKVRVIPSKAPLVMRSPQGDFGAERSAEALGEVPIYKGAACGTPAHTPRASGRDSLPGRAFSSKAQLEGWGKERPLPADETDPASRFTAPFPGDGGSGQRRGAPSASGPEGFGDETRAETSGRVDPMAPGGPHGSPASEQPEPGAAPRAGGEDQGSEAGIGESRETPSHSFRAEI